MYNLTEKICILSVLFDQHFAEHLPIRFLIDNFILQNKAFIRYAVWYLQIWKLLTRWVSKHKNSSAKCIKYLQFFRTWNSGNAFYPKSTSNVMTSPWQADLSVTAILRNPFKKKRDNLGNQKSMKSKYSCSFESSWNVHKSNFTLIQWGNPKLLGQKKSKFIVRSNFSYSSVFSSTSILYWKYNNRYWCAFAS